MSLSADALVMSLGLVRGIPLELFVSVGGPFKRALGSLRERGAPWRTSLFGAGARRLRVLESALKEELKSDFGVPLVLLDGATGEAGVVSAENFFGPEFQVRAALSEAEALVPVKAWAQAIFPSLEELWLEPVPKILADYEREMPLVGLFPWEDLRFFPGYLRTYRSDLISLSERAALDWARFQAEASPHDEVGEAASLSASEVMVNPTLQIVRFETTGEMIFVARDPRTGGLAEHRAMWMEAALVETASEEFRIKRDQLLTLVESAELELPEAGALKRVGTYEEHLDLLIAAGVLLVG